MSNSIYVATLKAHSCGAKRTSRRYEGTLSSLPKYTPANHGTVEAFVILPSGQAGMVWTCTGCGQRRFTSSVNQLRARVTGTKCDARCTSATGHDCECQCGGKNHGIDS
jgi:hypothetical protein